MTREHKSMALATLSRLTLYNFIIYFGSKYSVCKFNTTNCGTRYNSGIFSCTQIAKVECEEDVMKEINELEELLKIESGALTTESVQAVYVWYMQALSACSCFWNQLSASLALITNHVVLKRDMVTLIEISQPYNV